MNPEPARRQRHSYGYDLHVPAGNAMYPRCKRYSPYCMCSDYLAARAWCKHRPPASQARARGNVGLSKAVRTHRLSGKCAQMAPSESFTSLPCSDPLRLLASTGCVLRSSYRQAAPALEAPRASLCYFVFLRRTLPSNDG